MIRIRPKVLAKIKSGGAIEIDRADPRARLFDVLAGKGEVSTSLRGTRIRLSKGDGTSCPPLAKAKAVRGATHLTSWAIRRREANAKPRSPSGKVK